MFKRIAAFVACVALIASPPGETLVMAAHGETVFYVRPEGDRAAWEHAPRNRVYSDLQGAIDAAAKQTPAQVLVAVGVYNPTTAPNGGQTPHFSLKNGVTVTGGFKGDESGLVPAYGILEKDMADQSTQTVLKATVGFVFDHPSSAGIRRDAVLSNVTITGSETGGMRNADASPTIKNCIFTGNTGETGGGLQSLYGSPLVLSCYFVNNTAVLNGGGAAVTGGNPEFSNCTFAGNKAGESGGALYLENTDISIESTVFEGNANLSCDGGAIAAANDTALKLTNCHVNNNSSARHGGGVQISSGSAGFLNCLFEGNKGLYGGAIRADGALLSITNCTFSANSASQGGGVYMERPVAAILLGSEFHRNLADSGGGLYSFLSNVTLYNCKFTENAAKTGGGTENAGGSLSAANCVFAGNFGEQSGGGVKSGKTDASDSRLRLTNCTVSGNKSSVGAGVFSEDYAVFMANSLLAGNRKNTEADNFLSKAQLPADIKSTIIGEYFYETANVKTESGFDPERHFYEDCALVPHDGSRKNPAMDCGDVTAFMAAYEAVTKQAFKSVAPPPLALNGAARFGTYENAQIDCGAYEANSAGVLLLPPAPVVSATSGGMAYADGGRTNSVVELTAAADLSRLENFPFLPVTGYLPMTIFYEGDDGESRPFLAPVLCEQTGAYRFWTALGDSASGKTSFTAAIDNEPPKVTDIRFLNSYGETGDSMLVPPDTAAIALTFSKPVHPTDTSVAALISLSSEEGVPVALGAGSVSGDVLTLDLSEVFLQNREKYLLKLTGYKDGSQNEMTPASLYFAVGASWDDASPRTASAFLETADLPMTDGEIGEAELFEGDGGNAVVDGFGVASGGQARSLAGILPETAGAVSSSGTSLVLVVNGAPRFVKDLDMTMPFYDLNIGSVGGKCSAIAFASDLLALHRANPGFEVRVHTPFGSAALPGNLTERVPGFSELLERNGVALDDVSARLTLQDLSADPAVLAEASGLSGETQFKSAVVGFAVDILGPDGKVLETVSAVSGGIDVSLNFAPGAIIEAADGVHSLGEAADAAPGFVPWQTEDESATFKAGSSGAYVVARRDASVSGQLTHWGKVYLDMAAGLGLMPSDSETPVDPDAEISKTEFIAVIRKLLVNGSEANLLPSLAEASNDGPITREEAAGAVNSVLLLSGRQKSTEDVLLYERFTDYEDIEDAYGVRSAVAAGVMRGTGGAFAPKAAVTKAQCAVIACKLAEALR